MPWLIRRTAPQEPTAYWGSADRWVHRVLRPSASGPQERVPDCAVRYERHAVAVDVSDWLRAHQPMAPGEVLSVVPDAGAVA